ncbi:peptidase inhibitor family I36 protein [Kitasatospora sp. NPDC092948]|uniref:peptidase inhibitor family I36 protein n=1 Tax=Kitasatospora sp. NPDC092948 TaxID=3364088 RepID=UPI003809E358
MRVKTMLAATAVFAALISPNAAFAADSSDVVINPQSTGQCSSGKFCIWTITLSRGAYYGITSDVSNFNSYDGGGVYHNNQSYWNRTGKNWCLYSGTDYNNQIGWIAGTDTQSFDFGSGTKDNLGSMRVC